MRWAKRPRRKMKINKRFIEAFIHMWKKWIPSLFKCRTAERNQKRSTADHFFHLLGCDKLNACNKLFARSQQRFDKRRKAQSNLQKKMIKHHTNRNQNSLWCAVRAHNWSQIKRKRARHIQKLCTLDLCVSSKRMGTSIWYFARVSKHRLQRSLALSHQNSSRGDLPVIEPLPA